MLNYNNLRHFTTQYHQAVSSVLRLFKGIFRQRVKSHENTQGNTWFQHHSSVGAIMWLGSDSLLKEGQILIIPKDKAISCKDALCCFSSQSMCSTGFGHCTVCSSTQWQSLWPRFTLCAPNNLHLSIWSISSWMRRCVSLLGLLEQRAVSGAAQRHRNLLSLSSWGQKSEIKVSTGPGSLWAIRLTPFCLFQRLVVCCQCLASLGLWMCHSNLRLRHRSAFSPRVSLPHAARSHGSPRWTPLTLGQGPP